MKPTDTYKGVKALEIYKVPNFESITDELIIALIDRYKTQETNRMTRLMDYYIAKSDVKSRAMTDSSKPNNKIANPFASYIVDTVQGYFLGKPVAYQSDNEDLMVRIQTVYDRNHEQAHNSKMGKQLSITGIAYELMYMNEQNEVKFAMIDPREVFMIYDNSIEQKSLMAVRFYDVHDYVTDEEVTHIELYSNNMIQYCTIGEDALVVTDESPHYFKEVPVIVYKNNDEMTGDFEKVIDQIDAYDLAVSDTANNLEYFADSYLVLTNMEGTEPSDIAEMKENRVMLLGENGKAQWLVKSQENMEVESYKDRLRNDLHSLSHVPNMNDESFANAQSGESLKYKLFGLENMVSIKESLFKKALESRVRLITNIMNVQGGQHSYTDIQMKFSRNLPSNAVAWADVASKLAGLVSQETLLSILPFVDNPAEELIRINTEKQGTMYESFFDKDSMPTDTDVEDDLQ